MPRRSEKVHAPSKSQRPQDVSPDNFVNLLDGEKSPFANTIHRDEVFRKQLDEFAVDVVRFAEMLDVGLVEIALLASQVLSRRLASPASGVV